MELEKIKKSKKSTKPTKHKKIRIDYFFCSKSKIVANLETSSRFTEISHRRQQDSCCWKRVKI